MYVRCIALLLFCVGCFLLDLLFLVIARFGARTTHWEPPRHCLTACHSSKNKFCHVSGAHNVPVFLFLCPNLFSVVGCSFDRSDGRSVGPSFLVLPPARSPVRPPVFVLVLFLFPFSSSLVPRRVSQPVQRQEGRETEGAIA